MTSLRSRQIISALAIILLGILIFGGLAYYFMHHRDLEKEKNELSSQGYGLLGYLEFKQGVFQIEPSLKNDFLAYLVKNNFSKLSSEKYAYVQNTNTKNIVWHSQYPFNDISDSRFAEDKAKVFTTFLLTIPPDTDGVDLINPQTTLGRNISKLDTSNEYFVYARGFSYQPHGNYQLILAKSAKSFRQSLDNIIRNSAIIAGSAALLVLVAQFLSSFLVIQPIKQFVSEIQHIESGQQRLINNEYPKELSSIKGAVNALLNAEKGQKQRYRDALDDLAHSLKTPLSVLQREGEKSTDDTVASQVERMNEIVAYQLRRAVISEHGAIIKQEPVRPMLYRIKDSLIKVHHEKSFDFIINVDESAKCRMEQDDMMEVFGHLLNNACRFCNSVVEVNSHQDGDMLVIDIDDDGMGFPDKNPAELLQRGIRADSHSEGQGIGLATSTEIVEAIGGKIELLISPQVGARVRLHLPT